MYPRMFHNDTVWDEDFSSGLECGGVNSFKIDDDGEVTDLENNDNENTFDFNFIFFQSFRTQSFISGLIFVTWPGRISGQLTTY